MPPNVERQSPQPSRTSVAAAMTVRAQEVAACHLGCEPGGVLASQQACHGEILHARVPVVEVEAGERPFVTYRKPAVETLAAHRLDHGVLGRLPELPRLLQGTGTDLVVAGPFQGRAAIQAPPLVGTGATVRAPAIHGTAADGESREGLGHLALRASLFGTGSHGLPVSLPAARPPVRGGLARRAVGVQSICTGRVLVEGCAELQHPTLSALFVLVHHATRGHYHAP